MIVEANSFDAALFTAQYELLRSQVSGSSGVRPGAPRGVGLALLLRDGLPGWLKAVAGLIRAFPTPDSADPAHLPSLKPAATDESLPWLAGVVRQDLTTLLASLVLSTRSAREGYSSCP